MSRKHFTDLSTAFFVLAMTSLGIAAEKDSDNSLLKLLKTPGDFKALKNPQCSYCNVQHKKGFVRDNDRVLAWLRSSHNGGAIPLRHFLSKTRVINDTYGIFFYDPDGGYVSSFERSRGYKHVYEFHGWRNVVMVVKGNDGSLVSALSGEIFAGPRKGQRLKRIPSMLTNWKDWLAIHPESVAYRMYDGKKFIPAPLPDEQSSESRESMTSVDERLKPTANVIGVNLNGKRKAWKLDGLKKTHAFGDNIGKEPIVVLWDPKSKTAVSYKRKLGDQTFNFDVDKNASATAPFRDRETGSHWTMAGRAIDGPLKGKALDWAEGIQSRWFAWISEYPGSELHIE